MEDNIVNQKVLSKQLKKAGHNVSVANHGEEALKVLECTDAWAGTFNGRKLSIILMDLEMPVMNGVSCVRNIRCLQQEGKITRHIPVLAVTANARDDQVMQSMNAGMVKIPFP